MFSSSYLHWIANQIIQSFYFSQIRSDTESADVKQSKQKKFNLNFEGLFKKKQQKLDHAGDNEDPESPNEEDDNAAPSEATVIIEDDPPRKVSLSVWADAHCWKGP